MERLRFDDSLTIPAYIEVSIFIFVGILTNFYLQFKTTQSSLNNFYSTIYLAYDIFQLGFLLYLTGGITNPFIFLLIIPAVFCSRLWRIKYFL